MVKGNPISDIPVSEITLVHQGYFDSIEQKLEKRPQPTVGDAVQIMRNLGNPHYIKHFPYIFGLEKPFKPNENIRHELCHIAARAGHTPQQEFFGLAFNEGFNFGIGTRGFTPDAVKELHALMDAHKAQYFTTAASYQLEPPEPISKSDEAIYFAAGMYLREKIDAYKRSGMIGASYAEQKQFCDSYRDGSHTPHTAIPRTRLPDDYNADDLLDAPYPLITLSRGEWRAIIAVATNRADPKDIDLRSDRRDASSENNVEAFRKRLAAVKAALVNTNLLYDAKERGEPAQR